MRTAGPIAHPAVRGLPPRVTMARPRARTTPATLPPRTTVTAAMRARTNQATGQRPPTVMAALPARTSPGTGRPPLGMTAPRREATGRATGARPPMTMAVRRGPTSLAITPRQASCRHIPAAATTSEGRRARSTRMPCRLRHPVHPPIAHRHPATAPSVRAGSHALVPNETTRGWIG